MKENLFLGKLNGFVWVGDRFLLFPFHKQEQEHRFPHSQASWKGDCAPEFQEQHPALPQSILQGMKAGKRHLGIIWEGGFGFQPGQGVLEMLEGPCCSHSPPAAPSSQSFHKIVLSQNGLERILRIIYFQNPSRRDLDPFSTPRNKPS